MASLTPLKTRQREIWSSGDFSSVGAKIVLTSEVLCENTGLQAGWRVLDVATGSGNTAIAAARRGCEATGLDFAANLLERGRVRAAAEGFDIEFIEGDAEQLPFADGSFDAVVSTFGVMFAPDQRRTAVEVARVCRPGGRIGLASWVPAGFVGELFATISAHVPPPAGVPSPLRWGDDQQLGELFGGGAASRQSHRRTVTFNFISAEEYVSFFRARFGPMINAFNQLAPDGQARLTADVLALVRKYDRNKSTNGPVAIAGEYLETVIVRA